MHWTPELAERAKALHADGLSAQEIADALDNGISRNAVVGKLHRLAGYRRSEHPPQATGERKHPEPKVPTVAKIGRPAKHRQAGSPQRRPPPPPLWTGAAPAENGRGGSWSPFRTCQFLLGGATGDHYFFCGAENVPGYSYCEKHCRVVYQNWRGAK